MTYDDVKIRFQNEIEDKKALEIYTEWLEDLESNDFSVYEALQLIYIRLDNIKTKSQ